MKKHTYNGFLLTCCCEEADSEGKLWDDRLRGGGWGGSRLCGALVWDGCDDTGIIGSCILSTGGVWVVVGWAGPAVWGLSGSGSNGEPLGGSAGLVWVSGVGLPPEGRPWLCGALITPARGGIVGLVVPYPAVPVLEIPGEGGGWLRTDGGGGLCGGAGRAGGATGRGGGGRLGSRLWEDSFCWVPTWNSAEEHDRRQCKHKSLVHSNHSKAVLIASYFCRENSQSPALETIQKFLREGKKRGIHQWRKEAGSLSQDYCLICFNQ